jgi:tetratricopeptide (TPR) repeat protein
MKAFVYGDASLERYAGRFVWLSLNTEDAKNAAFLKRYPIPALPTLLVLDPKRDEVALRHIGGATIPQLKTLLGEAENTYREKSQSAASKLLVRGDRLSSDSKHAEAADAYEQAIQAAPRNWRTLGRAAEAFLFALMQSEQGERCAKRAFELHGRLKGTLAGGNVAAMGLGCAASLPKEHAKRVEWMQVLEKAARAAFDDPKIVMSDDDRSGFYINFIGAREAAGDEEGVVRLTHEWSAFLDGAAARAKTPQQRTVFDSHRLSAYLELGTPDKAVPMLDQSERDFPDDYNPPARLALAYKAMKEYDKAIAASDRALARVEGPRKLTILSARADIFTAKGDTKAAKETIQQAVEYAKSLPEGQRSDRRIASLEKRLASMQ